MPGTLTVVVADDDDGVLDVLSRAISSQPDMRLGGTATDGAEAVRRCAEAGADVAVLDVRMPAGGGEAAARRLSREHPETGIVVFTSSDDPHTREQMRAAGADQFVVKGAPLADLLEAVREAARSRRRGEG